MVNESTPTVLAVNDQPDNLDLLTVVLRNAGYRVLTAQSGDEAYETARAHRPHVIVSDVLMPGTGGIELCRLVRNDPGLRATPVLLVSAQRRDSESAVDGLRAGADLYIEAPFDPVRLVAQVSRLAERRAWEQALEESERKYRMVVEGVREVIFRLDRNGRWEYLNPAWAELTGYGVEESIGRRCFRYVHPEDRRRVLRAFTLLMEERRNDCREEVRFLTKSGGYRWVEVNSRFLLDESEGRHAGGAGTLTDITVRRRAEQAQRRSETQFRAVFEHTGMGVALVRVDRRMLDVNPALARMLGYDGDELRAMTFPEITHPEDVESDVSLFRELLDGRRECYQIEKRYLKKGGEIVWGHLNATLVRGAGGEALYAVGSVVDVTEQKRVEDALRRSEELYRGLVENAKDMIITHDLAGNYTSVNRAALEITGYTLDEALSMNFSQVVAPEYVEAAREMVRKKLAGEEEQTTYELELLAKDGRRVTLEVSSWLVYRESAPVGVQAIGRDITERRQLESRLRQAQKMEAVGRLAGGVAHDFNNLLTAINGYADLTLMRLRPKDPLYRNVREIREAGERASGLTRQLLAFSRQQVLQPKVINLNDAVRHIEKMLSRLIGADVELSTSLDPSARNVRADPGQVEQVIMNLVVNARDAMPRGGRLTIETRETMLDDQYAREHGVALTPGPYVMLAVSDTGVGMDAATRARIFEPFFTTKGPGEGTGLGLSTVYGIVKQSGGYVWAYSEVGEGTTFKVYLPVVAEEATPAAKPAATEIPGGDETVLLVEDEEMIRNLTKELLEVSGYTVLAAANGGEALLLCEQHPGTIHLMITDVVMPQMGGGVLAERVGGLRPEMRVLFMSGYTDAAVVNHGVLHEGARFVQKPFTPELLLRKVRETLDAGGEAAGAG